MVTAIWAALKAGGVVVILPADQPQDRLKSLVREASVSLVLCGEGHGGPARAVHAGPVMLLNEEEAGNEGAAALPEMDPGQLAFLIQTSGSTGKPKLVMQTHANILHNAHRLGRGMELAETDRVTLLSSPAGGQGVATLFSALLHGAALGMFPVGERGVVGLAAWMQSSAITVYVSAASLFRSFLGTLDPGVIFTQIRLVRMASEPATAADFHLFRRHFPAQAVLFSTLSSSETGNITQARMTSEDHVGEGRLTVGSAVEDVEILLLDPEGNPVERGRTGEIVVRSPYLSPGYWQDEKRSGERFGWDAEGRRIYRSGDLGCLREDGLLMFQGRRDGQVKIRGYRIELHEVEEAIAAESFVAQAAVGVRTNARGEPRLVAYVVTVPGHRGSSAMLRGLLKSRLPAYMIPGQFVFLDALPVTAQGKVDRHSLQEHSVPLEKAKGAAGFVSDVERELAALWEEVFETGGLSPEDDFFELGGDSLTAAVLGSKIHERWGVEVHLETLGRHSRIADLAQAMETMQLRPAPRVAPLARVSRDAHLPLSFCQEHCWKASQSPGGAAGQTVIRAHRLSGPLDVDVFRRSLDAMVARFELLRTTYHGTARPGMVIHPPGPAFLREVDFSQKPDPEAEALAYYQYAARKVFDTATLPLFEFHLLKISSHEHQFLRVGHHIGFDGWSWKIFFEELGRCYECLQSGRPLPVEDPERRQYADYAHAQRSLLEADSAAFRQQMDWWSRQFRKKPRSCEFPFRRAVPAPEAPPSDGSMKWGLDPAVSAQLDGLARAADATYFTLRMAVYSVWAARAAQQSSVAVGAYMSQRDRAGLHDMFGFFSNLVGFCFHIPKHARFVDWLRTVHDHRIALQTANHIPYQVVEDHARRSGIRPPSIQTILHIASHRTVTRFGGVEVKWLARGNGRMPWGFSVVFNPADEARSCVVMFDARIYDPRGVREYIDGLARFFQEVACDPEARLEDLLARSGVNTLYPRTWRLWPGAWGRG
jgi:acyl-coenzyme A synthetase/AMP-(fatty) acid ligase/acyl carrier protein